MRSEWLVWALFICLAYPLAALGGNIPVSSNQTSQSGDAIAQTDLGTKYALGSEVASDYRPG